MVNTSVIHDILGNEIILLPISITPGDAVLFSDLLEVVQHPRFVILVRGESNYYFKPLSFKLNLLVEAGYEGIAFVLKGYSVNPDASYISVLLKRGRLISYSH